MTKRDIVRNTAEVAAHVTGRLSRERQKRGRERQGHQEKGGTLCRAGNGASACHPPWWFIETILLSIVAYYLSVGVQHRPASGAVAGLGWHGQAADVGKVHGRRPAATREDRRRERSRNQRACTTHMASMPACTYKLGIQLGRAITNPPTEHTANNRAVSTAVKRKTGAHPSAATIGAARSPVHCHRAPK